MEAELQKQQEGKQGRNSASVFQEVVLLNQKSISASSCMASDNATAWLKVSDRTHLACTLTSCLYPVSDGEVRRVEGTAL